MLGRFFVGPAMAILVLSASAFLPQQGMEGKRTLIINGQSTQVPLIHVNGSPYIGLNALADALNGSLSYSGDLVALSVPIGPANAASSTNAPAAIPQTTPAPAQAAPSSLGFSRGFLTAGIEQMSTLREWHAALASAIENGFPVTATLLAPYRAQASTNLRLAMVAAATPSDHSAYQLLNNEFQNMARLSDKYIQLRNNMTYVAPDALQNDSLDGQIIACGHSLGAMAASGQFVDDGSCH